MRDPYACTDLDPITIMFWAKTFKQYNKATFGEPLHWDKEPEFHEEYQQHEHYIWSSRKPGDFICYKI